MGKVRCQLCKTGGETEAREVKEPTQSCTESYRGDFWHQTSCEWENGEKIYPHLAPFLCERKGEWREERRKLRSSKELTPGKGDKGTKPRPVLHNTVNQPVHPARSIRVCKRAPQHSGHPVLPLTNESQRLGLNKLD